MTMRLTILAGILFLTCAAVGSAKRPTDQKEFPPLYVPSGQHMYAQFCVNCHGFDGKGSGPASSSLKVPPPDLTTLAMRHNGKFPYTYVTSILLFGPGVSAHGSSGMPTWGPIFLFIDKQNEAAVRQRIKNISDYLVSLQEK